MMNADSAKLSSLLRVDERGTISNTEPLFGYSGDYQFAVIARDRRHNGASATVFLSIVPYTRCQPTFSSYTSSVFEIEEVIFLILSYDTVVSFFKFSES